jgi:hypothetical protein
MPAPRPPRPRLLRVAHLIVGAAVTLLLALAFWVWDMNPEAARRGTRASIHEKDAETWRLAADWIASRDYVGQTPPRYRWVAASPTGVLGDRRRYDPMGRTDEYAYGLHVWLGPASIRGRETDIRDDLIAICRERVRYHIRLRDKWAFAARIPWSPVEEDGPGPPLVYAPTGDSY